MLNELVFDESITSARLEGANTTLMRGRDLLSSGNPPRDKSERMVVGNARLMAAIEQHLKDKFSVELVRQLHYEGMSGIHDEEYKPGELRTDEDQVVIKSIDNEVIYTPPSADSLPGRLWSVTSFVNDDSSGIHPLVKAIILHFMIAHEHPFRDGNGRTSRALFYWYMLKNGYDAFNYLSISNFLANAPVEYAKRYQFTETDEMDLTYFIEYQCEIVRRAIERFDENIEQVMNIRMKYDQLLYESGAHARLSQRQITILNVIYGQTHKVFNAKTIAARFGTTENTARADLRALVEEGLLEAVNVNEQTTGYKAITED
ncbi:Fic family protein [Salmonella enterica]|nr:Fic family protein [Salmonella enterica]